MSNTMPPPPPMYPPQPPPPRRGPSNAVVIGSAAAVIAAVVATGIVVVNSGDDDKKPEKTASAAASDKADDVVADQEEPAEETEAESEPEGTDGEAAGLNDTVDFREDVQLSLSKFARGTSGPYGSPENTPYVKFVVRVKNNGKSTVDTSMFTASCSYGTAGKSSESIFDSDQGLNGGPDTKLLAGRSLSVTWACALPKAEKTIQIEVSPDMDLEAEAAIFTGDVK
ncbi:hypothetical protein DEJ49_12575 [Streptomyces venezuelae]|uniref:DUF4352 domain-containing protein n=1 Tax=Streptomyces venezuelae TaxID=54571 RepID=A0A5P2CFY4_STRVZ|nr:DUF4352 domain-containing protein [Streptomyces venezuelae]QES41736.1 hypothetical protein DEJ49_12575 [Streptomyces venezuelae]